MPTKTKLHQMIAVASGLKEATQQGLTKAHQIKPETLNGLTRNYRPKAEDGEQLPPEVKLVQQTVPDVIKIVCAELARMLDVVRTNDEGNARARADVVVDGATLLERVPVTHLLYIAHRLDDLITFIKGLPTLDPSEQWLPDERPGVWRTRPFDTLKQAKVMKHYVSYEATKEHPAQVQVYNTDETVGTWTNVKLSAAVPPAVRDEMALRARKLRDAVKMAREEANSIEIEQFAEGAKVLGYVFGDLAAP